MKQDETDPREETGPFRRAEHFRQLRDTKTADEEGLREAQVREARAANLRAAPIPGGSNWLPIGPGLVSNGQAATAPGISGRLTGVVVTEGGRVYVGAANGGVWRSDDRGHSWRPLMDGANRRTGVGRADTLAVGAIAVPRQDPNRVYVGTGEGGMGGDGFFGVGPLRSDDGGETWVSESWSGGPSAFFQLAIEPSDPDRVLAGTSQGLLLRQPRNQNVPGLPWPRPTAYRYRYDPASGQLRSEYWAADGRTTVQVAVTTWAPDLVLQAVELDSSPWLWVYRTSNAHPSGAMASGRTMLIPVPPDGGIPDLGTGSVWDPGLSLFDFELDGQHYFGWYAPATGVAQLTQVREPYDAGFVDVGAPMNWGRWAQIVPLVLHGAPHLLLYQDLTAGNPRQARLLRWTPQLTLDLVWESDEVFAAAQQLVPLVLKGRQALLQYDPTNGDATLFDFRVDGTPFRDWRRRQVLLPGATLAPFSFLNRQEQGYRNELLIQATAGDGTVALYDVRARFELVWKQLGQAGLVTTPFDIGYGWNDLTSRLAPQPQVVAVTSVAITQRGPLTRYFAAVQARTASFVFVSDDRGWTWTQLGQLPVTGRLSLGTQPDEPDLVYVFCQDSALYRLDFRDGRSWRRVQRTPPAEQLANQQGWYDLAVAVAPEDPFTVFLGGAAVWASSPRGSNWSAAIYRCRIHEEQGALVADPVYLGASVHADVHGFGFTPGRSGELWVACDGGLFVTTDARRPATGDLVHLFEPRNAGLLTMTVNRTMPWDAAEDAVITTSTQDNGLQVGRAGLRYDLAVGGDSGTSVRHGNDVLMTFEQLKLGLSTDRGQPNTFQSLPNLQAVVTHLGDKVLFYPPLVQRPGSDDLVAGTVRPWISHDLGRTWAVIPTVLAPAAEEPQVPWPGAGPFPPAAENIAANQITAMCWESQTRFFAGTLGGVVRRYVLVGPDWTPTNVALPNPQRPITSLTFIGPDQLYVTVGGGAGTRLFRLDLPSSTWTPLPGAPGHALPDIQMNTLVDGGADGLFVGGDIGVWRSTDGGANWEPFSQGLPESAVLDLSYYPANPAGRTRPALIRASTHGRGLWDRAIRAVAPDVALLLRVNPLDTGLEDRRTAADPVTAAPYTIRDGACIKPMNPGPNGHWPAPATVPWDLFDHLPDASRQLVSGQPVRLYIRVDDRGIAPARKTHLSVFVSHQYAPLPVPLPNDLMAWAGPPGMRPEYWRRVLDRQLVRDARYDIPAVLTVPTVGVESPRVVSVDLPSTSFPTAGLYCIVVIASDPEDPFDSQERDIDALVTGDRHVASKFLAIR